MLIALVNSIFNVYHLILLARVFMSWLPNLDPTHPVVMFLYGVTEPVLRPIRNLLPTGTMFDFSPIVIFLLLPIVQRLVIQLLAAFLY
ncbi:MAG: YggT family protein [Firmicutes bacterium]|nr:YggT family protein [Bacillota bacterium]